MAYIELESTCRSSTDEDPALENGKLQDHRKRLHIDDSLRMNVPWHTRTLDGTLEVRFSAKLNLSTDTSNGRCTQDDFPELFSKNPGYIIITLYFRVRPP